MKVRSFFKNIFILSAIVAFTACSDDETASVLSTKTMLNQELVASNNSFVWNGTKSWRKDDVKAKFEAIEGDTTKMKMTISGIVPSSDDDIQLIVDVYPKSDEILYQGKVENNDYDMTVSGLYFPSRSSVGHYFKLKIAYDVVNANFMDKSYNFNLKNGCVSIPRANSGELTIDGQTYSKGDVANNVLSGMTKLYAKKDSVVEFTFAKDGSLSLDLLNNSKGNTVTSNLITPKYWFVPTDNILVFEFTKEQAETFAEKFLNKNVDNIESLFTKYLDTDKYILKARYYTENGKLSLELVSPYMEKAMSMFASGRASELGSTLQKQVEAYAAELNDFAEHWQIQFVSE